MTFDNDYDDDDENNATNVSSRSMQLRGKGVSSV